MGRSVLVWILTAGYEYAASKTTPFGAGCDAAQVAVFGIAGGATGAYPSDAPEALSVALALTEPLSLQCVCRS
jgi:hypothetical protein